MERWTLTYANRDASLGEVPARYETKVFEAATEGLEEQEIVHKLHHLIEEHTDGACILTEAEKVEADANPEA